MDKLLQLTTDMGKLWSQYGSGYLDGAKNTLLLAVIATAIGCVIGLLCGILQTIPHSKTDNPFKRFFLALVRLIIRVYVEVFRGTPMILQAVFIYFGLPYFTNNTLSFSNVWAVSILVVSINTGAYMAESVRGGILSIDPGQTEGAKAIGMSHWQTMLNVILPQALRNIMPQIGNNFIINVKDTSVMFIIGFTEFFAKHQGIVGATYKYFPSAAIEMLGYLTMTLAASILLRFIERRMDGADSYDLVQTDSLTMSAGNYNHPHHGAPFAERSPEGKRNAETAKVHRQAGIDPVQPENKEGGQGQ
ncbi:MAG: amino acid ABC transporter permease [Oscillibacter sp.]